MIKRIRIFIYFYILYFTEIFYFLLAYIYFVEKRYNLLCVRSPFQKVEDIVWKYSILFISHLNFAEYNFVPIMKALIVQCYILINKYFARLAIT